MEIKYWSRLSTELIPNSAIFKREGVGCCITCRTEMVGVTDGLSLLILHLV